MKPAYEIRVQRLHETPGVGKLDHPQVALDYWRKTIAKMPWFDADREQAVSVMLNTRYNALGRYT